jgi:glycosyltransferase involved in cell wall biosynthesis
MAKVSIIIPANGEKFLQPTIKNLIANARGDYEIIAVLDGYWPDPPLADHPRLSLLHWGTTRGMRPAINAAVEMAKGEFLMKIDAHCSVTEGFDEVLAADCADDWIVVPRRGSLDPYREPFGQLKENGKSAVDYHYLSYPFEQNRPGAGLHGTVWNERARTRLHLDFDDEMSSQGSCWFMTRKHWYRIGPMETHNYGNFIQEMQEIGLKTWLGGGQMKINKRCKYLHWHKGQEGRGYFIDRRQMHRGSIFCVKHWMTDSWAERKRNMRWLIEHFWPVPTWPRHADGSLDWDTVERDTAHFCANN